MVSASAAGPRRGTHRCCSTTRCQAVMPPWGGELLIDILPHLDWPAPRQAARPEWIIGYSDLSTFMFAYTLRTHIATLNGIQPARSARSIPPAPSLRVLERCRPTVPGRHVHAACRILLSGPDDVDWAANSRGHQFDRTAPVPTNTFNHEDDGGYTCHCPRSPARRHPRRHRHATWAPGTATSAPFARPPPPRVSCSTSTTADMNAAQYCRHAPSLEARRLVPTTPTPS